MPTRHAASLPGFLILAIALQGCSKLYLHQDNRETLAREASAAFDEATSADLFDRAIEDLESHLSMQREAAWHMITAAQDLQLAALIEGQDVAALQVGNEEELRPPAQQLIGLVRNRMLVLVGEAAAGEILQRTKLQAIRAIQESRARRIASDKQNISRFREAYREHNGTAANTCRKPTEKMEESPPETDDPGARALYSALLTACNDLGALVRKMQADRRFGIDPTVLAGDYKAVLDELAELNGAKAQLDEARKSLSKELKRLEAAYKQALVDAKQHPESRSFQADLADKARQVTEFIADLGTPAALVARVSELSNGEIDLEEAESTVAVPGVFVGELLSAEVLETNMASLLSQAVDLSGEATTSEAMRARSLWLLTIRSVDVFARLQDSYTEPTAIPSPNALLIGIAYQRHRNAVAAVSERQVEAKIAAKKLEQASLMEEIFQLWSAHHAATAMTSFECGKEAAGFAEFMAQCSGDRKARVIAAQALVAYDQAWSLGLAKSTLAAMDASGLEQRLAIETARENAGGWFGILRPALAELVAYGEGGIRAATISNLITALGLGSIAAGVN